MEDIIKALLDVVRAQHSAAEGTDEEPFDMNDIVDMAMNIVGRPDESEEVAGMVDSIQKLVETLAPDIFPPKTFEEMDDAERAASAASMIEESLKRGRMGGKNRASVQNTDTRQEAAASVEDRVSSENNDVTADRTSGYEESFDAQQTAELNDLIYKNLMEMMGTQNPQVEYPFDLSQIQYGREKSVTEMLEEEREEEEKLKEEQKAMDEQIHEKEPYVPQVLDDEPTTKSATQLAAEAIRRSQEEDREKLEIEKQAERLMEEAKKRGQDPMKFALHQQEILRYMEKNSDELVSFEDYEDLSPEEKYEIERQIYIEKQLEDGVNPEDVDDQVPEEFIPEELKATAAAGREEETKIDESAFSEEDLENSDDNVSAEVTEFQTTNEEASSASSFTEQGSATEGEDVSGDSFAAMPPVLTEEMLRQLSQEVIQENSDMILSENENEDMGSLNDLIMNNIKAMMSGSGAPVQQEDVTDLLEQAAASAKGENTLSAGEDAADSKTVGNFTRENVGQETETRGMSAVELAKAAQKAAKPDPEEIKEGVSAVELAKKAQEKAREAKAQEMSEPEIEDVKEAQEKISEPDTTEEDKKEPEEEFEYVDPDELVLGEHTQAEIDEAIDNLNSLGLEGEVYERAKRMLLLELAGSEAELDSWLREQEIGKKKKASVSALDGDDDSLDLDDLDEELLEKELELAMDEDFLESSAEEAEEIGQVDIEEEVKESTDQDGEEDIISEVEVEDTVPVPGADRKKSSLKKTTAVSKKKVVKRREKKSGSTKTETNQERNIWKNQERPVEEKEYQVSLRHPFVLKNSASFMDQFERYIADTQENRKLSTGFKKLDAMLRYGLHKGTYFIDSKPQYLKNSFMQQMADRAAESGVDVLYISTELSRYDLMVDTISRLSYEIHQGDFDKAVSVMSIMTGEDGADLESLKDELNWYRGRISEHLYILDQEVVSEYIESMEDASAGDILAELIRSIVRDGVHKPVVFIDNIENILSVEDSEDIKPLMEGTRRLAGELEIPIIMSYGYAQAESETEISAEESEFHALLGNMCDVYMELQYADMITEDSMEITEEDIQEMMEEGDTLLINVLLHRNRRPLRASCQIQGTPKFNYFEE